MNVNLKRGLLEGAAVAAICTHSAAVLQDGRVLIAGGSNGSTDLATGEVYDAAANTFSRPIPMSAARHRKKYRVRPPGKTFHVDFAAGTLRLHNPIDQKSGDPGSGHNGDKQQRQNTGQYFGVYVRRKFEFVKNGHSHPRRWAGA